MNWIKRHALLLLLGFLVIFWLGVTLTRPPLLRIAQVGLVALSFFASGLAFWLRIGIWTAAAWTVGYSLLGTSFNWLYSWLPKNAAPSSFSVTTQ